MSKDMTREEKRQKQVSRNPDWSKLCPDLLRTILENSSLNFIDLQQAKTVCSDWYHVWRTCVKPPLYPWQIILEGDYSMLFDPREDKFYRTKHLGLDISDNNYCIATSGNWLLLVDPRLNTYLLNVLTRKRINLPLMYSSFVDRILRFDLVGSRRVYIAVPPSKELVSNQSAVLSINERTGDYFVAWIYKNDYLFTHKKGDDSWRNWNAKGTNLGILDLAYKNNKLYIYTRDDHIKILDFSGDFPKEEIEKNPYRYHPFDYIYQPGEYPRKKKISIRNSGEVLVIDYIESYREKPMFYIFKMNLESKKWERVKSIGDNEMLIYGHGVTIRAPVQDIGGGFNSDSVCYVEGDFCPGGVTPNSGVFDLATSRITFSKKFHHFIEYNSTWFVPGFAYSLFK